MYNYNNSPSSQYDMIALTVSVPSSHKTFPIKVNPHSVTVSKLKDLINNMQSNRSESVHSRFGLYLKPTKDTPEGVWLEKDVNSLYEYRVQHCDTLEYSMMPDKRKDESRQITKDDFDMLTELDPVGPNESLLVLKGIKGPLTGLVFEIGEKGAIIGRSRTFGCNIVISGTRNDGGDLTVSRQHAQLVYKPGSFFLKNLSNNNVTGVLVSGNSTGIVRLNQSHEMELFSVCINLNLVDFMIRVIHC